MLANWATSGKPSWGRKPNQKIFHNQPGRQSAVALESQIRLDEPLVKLRASFSAEVSELALGLSEHKGTDPRLFQGGGDVHAMAGCLASEDDTSRSSVAAKAGGNLSQYGDWVLAGQQEAIELS